MWRRWAGAMVWRSCREPAQPTIAIMNINILEDDYHGNQLTKKEGAFQSSSESVLNGAKTCV